MVKQRNNPEESIIMSTMNIVPDHYSPRTSHDRIESAKYALAGLLFLLRRQQSMQWILLVSLTVSSLALILQVDMTQMLILLLALGVVWVTEAINTALEAAVNLITTDLHPMAKVCKDCAAAATLIASSLASLLTLLIIGPPLMRILP